MKMLIIKHLKLKKYPQNCELEATCVPNQIECNLSMGSTSTHKDTTHHKACEDRIISAVIIYQRPPLFIKLVIMDKPYRTQ